MEKGTILIVDDNKGVLASLELLLETEFSEIKTAGNPNQIISILNTSPTDVRRISLPRRGTDGKNRPPPRPFQSP